MNRPKQLKIGWLIPYSGVFRQLRKDLQQGVDTALKQEGAGVRVESYPEYIQSGGLKETEEALKKLLRYEQVDLVIGVLGTKTARGIIPMVESNRTPVIFLNLGADQPKDISSNYLFYNSLHLWKSEWAMGKWAQKKYGGEPSINMSIYESGYDLHDSFRIGTSFSGAETVKMNVVRNITGPPDTMPLISFIKEQQPQHTHALLSGKEGEQFLQLFQEHDLASKVGLTVNPFMVEDGLLTQIPSGVDLYNASTWALSLDTPDNRSFVQDYTQDWGESPNAFALLAYEAGLVLAAALEDAKKPVSRESLAASFGQVRPVGPRSVLALSTCPVRTDTPVYIRKPVLSRITGLPENDIVETLTGIEWDDPALFIKQDFSTGWQNPYLCV
ncbi:MAG: ABC transporter substrate-binding protein [Bacteroidetes bacterium]|nr:ABC transporter substrate-binding protein [Bacteroidota bacterium]